jgi:hypothetical protein
MSRSQDAYGPSEFRLRPGLQGERARRHEPAQAWKRGSRVSAAPPARESLDRFPFIPGLGSLWSGSNAGTAGETVKHGNCAEGEHRLKGRLR